MLIDCPPCSDGRKECGLRQGGNRARGVWRFQYSEKWCDKNTYPIEMKNLLIQAANWILLIAVDQGVQWFWIGSHADYDKLIA
ncbi:MAG: hypothetical protein HY306_07995 [Nitrosomonadales bacterium]|nr:hypothetical protein [Nitrosomonadales bacterium]